MRLPFDWISVTIAAAFAVAGVVFVPLAISLWRLNLVLTVKALQKREEQLAVTLLLVERELHHYEVLLEEARTDTSFGGLLPMDIQRK